MKKLIGPFRQIVTMGGLPLKGPIHDDKLEILEDAGILVDGQHIVKVGPFSELSQNHEVDSINTDMVLLPGLIDSHTHMCWGGDRAADYALRVSGATYQDILKRGGGIHETVRKTRESSEGVLKSSLLSRLDRHLSEGVTTVEIKSGYGLSVDEELKMLRVVSQASTNHECDVIPTCLAAHVRPAEFTDNQAYLEMIANELFPLLKERNLSNRIDIFVEDGAFDEQVSAQYLDKAVKAGFALTVHADQFSVGGTKLAVQFKALSADHLENSGDAEVMALANSDTVGTVLPGASLGLGMQYAPARDLLDAGVCLAIASDWNPGSAPMGDLLLQAALLGASEKLSSAETFSGITFRAAKALGLSDRGTIGSGMLADMVAFEVDDYREILWHQGKLKPSMVWKNGQRVVG